MRIGKRILTIATAVLLLVVSIVSMAVQTSALNYRKINIYIDGEKITGDPAVLIDDTTYVPVRYLSQRLRECTVTWNQENSTAYISASNLNIELKDNMNYINANGRYLYSPAPIRILENERMYVPVRLLARAFGASVEWDGATFSVYLKRGSGTIQSGDQFYNKDDLYWLSRIISAESRGEPLLGQIAVGNVVINRVKSPSYPNSVYGVIFDNKYAVQFTPTANGTIYNTPSESSVIAAKICLEGYTVSNDIYYFFEQKAATSTWIASTRTFRFIIGSHRFYA